MGLSLTPEAQKRVEVVGSAEGLQLKGSSHLLATLRLWFGSWGLRFGFRSRATCSRVKEIGPSKFKGSRNLLAPFFIWVLGVKGMVWI